MKVGILSVSKKGYDLSLKIKNELDNDSTVIKCDVFHKDVKNTFNLLFFEYDAVVAIMASGILIRSISHLIESKTTDPAVLNIDDNGNFVISMLSGHLGGANQFTYKIAELIDATPVVTTSTDVNKKLGIDVLARDLYLSIDNTKEILHFNKSILEGKKVSFTVNSSENYDYLFEYLSNNTLEIDVSIYFSSKINDGEIEVECDNHKIILKPRKIVFGIGCRRGKTSNEIKKAVQIVLNDLNIDVSRISMFSSAEIKKDEKGILDLSEELDIPVNFVELDKLMLFKSNDIQQSEFVMSKFGIPGVCEPSALITAGYDSKLIYKKTAFDGVTVSVAISK